MGCYLLCSLNIILCLGIYLSSFIKDVVAPFQEVNFREVKLGVAVTVLSPVQVAEVAHSVTQNEEKIIYSFKINTK